jgi:hypothetical protein
MLLFKASGFTPAPANHQMQARVDILRQMTQPTIDALVVSNANYGIMTRVIGGVMGRGIFASNEVPAYTDVLMGFGTFMPSDTHFDSLGMVENYGSLICGGIDFDVLIDGRPIANELIASTDERVRQMHTVNAAWLNHGCGRKKNVEGRWVVEPASNLLYAMYQTSRKVRAGDELCSNYNEGVATAPDRFFRTYDDLFVSGVGAADIIRCGCRSGCTNAFDRRRVEPQPLFAPGAAVAVVAAAAAADAVEA